MHLPDALKGRVTQLIGAGAVSAYFGEGPGPGFRELIVLVFALLNDDNLVGLVNREGELANAETLPGFSGYGPIRFYEPR